MARNFFFLVKEVRVKIIVAFVKVPHYLDYAPERPSITFSCFHSNFLHVATTNGTTF